MTTAAWREDHREEHNASTRRYYRKNAESVKAYQKKWYEKNRESELARKKTQYDHLYSVLQRLKTLLGCSRCGYRAHVAALQWHHRDPATKKGVISSHIRQGRARLRLELAKCEVLCANCHSIEHYGEKK